MLSFCVCSGSLQAFVVLNEFEKAKEDLEKVNKLFYFLLSSPNAFTGGLEDNGTIPVIFV